MVASVDERWKRLNKLVVRRNAKFVYTYDLGDNGEHDVLVEGILSPEPERSYPVCIEGRRACPPEDVGGIWGYREFLKSIRNPRDREHDSWLQWVGGSFDPEKFDIAAVNRMLVVKRLRYWPF